MGLDYQISLRLNQSVKFECKGKDYSCTVEDFQMALDRDLLLNFRLTHNATQLLVRVIINSMMSMYMARISTLNNASEQTYTHLQTS